MMDQYQRHRTDSQLQEALGGDHLFGTMLGRSHRIKCQVGRAGFRVRPKIIMAISNQGPRIRNNLGVRNHHRTRRRFANTLLEGDVIEETHVHLHTDLVMLDMVNRELGRR